MHRLLSLASPAWIVLVGRGSARGWVGHPLARCSEKLWEVLGGLWEALGGSGKLWEVLGGSGRLWEALGSFGRLWEVLGGSGKLWEALGGSGRQIRHRTYSPNGLRFEVFILPIENECLKHLNLAGAFNGGVC